MATLIVRTLPGRILSGLAFLLIANLNEAIAISSDKNPNAPDFIADVKPIFTRHCSQCHGGEKQRGGLRFDSRDSAFSEGDSGEVPIIAGKPEQSELLRRVLSDDDGEWMPPEGPRLSESEIDILTRWIEEGSHWPESVRGSSGASSEMRVTDDDRAFWSFQRLKNVSVPESGSDWSRNPIDAFVWNRMQLNGLTPNPVASSLALQRRMYFDVVGLPPGEQTVVTANASADHFDADALVDSLLASDHFGERWARHWLDVARYADSNGYENDLDRPYAYQYRDFVIRAFNNDLPFKDFVQWQIAGDELESGNPAAVAATGFLAAGPLNRSAATAPDEVLQGIRYDELDDIVSTTSQAFLGLTLGCARCHDHKFDAIPTRDYYRMVAAFASSTRQESSLIRAQRNLDLWRKASMRKLLLEKISALDCTADEAKWLAAGPRNPAESKAAFKKYGKAIEFDEDDWRAWLPTRDRQELERLETAAKAEPAPRDWTLAPAVLVTELSSQPTEVRLLRRGDVGLPAEVTPPGFFTVLTRDRSFDDYHALAVSGDTELSSTRHRAALAMWLTDVEHGAGALTARVIVNRIWHHYFGTGLVDTPNDFGVQGSRPSHPDLLEWLAGELVRNRWNLKSIHRLILQSNTYRQSSRPNGSSSIDPTNRWLSRRRSKRLDSEATRDAILAASGRLNRKLHGPAIRPFIPTAAMATRSRDKWPTGVEEGPEHWRRSLYIFVKRSIRFPMMETFDAPAPTASCGRRVPTTVAVQALTLLNNPSIRGAARDFAESVKERVGKEPADQVASAFIRSLGRLPTKAESHQAVQFLDTDESDNALADLCHALLMCNEFVYIE